MFGTVNFYTLNSASVPGQAGGVLHLGHPGRNGERREHMYYDDLPCWCSGQPSFGVPHREPDWMDEAFTRAAEFSAHPTQRVEMRLHYSGGRELIVAVFFAGARLLHPHQAVVLGEIVRAASHRKEVAWLNASDQMVSGRLTGLATPDGDSPDEISDVRACRVRILVQDAEMSWPIIEVAAMRSELWLRLGASEVFALSRATGGVTR